MDTITIPREKIEIEKFQATMAKFQMKAMILDEILEFIEDKYFGHFMELTEIESNIPLAKAKRLMK